MITLDAVEIARRLREAMGPRAEAEASHRAVLCEKAGDHISAASWRKIRSVLGNLRSPPMS